MYTFSLYFGLKICIFIIAWAIYLMLNNFRCYLKLGSWAESSMGINEQSVPQILEYFGLATDHDKHWYKAWHMWALFNYEAVLFYKQKDHATGSSQNQEVNLPITPRPDTVSKS